MSGEFAAIEARANADGKQWFVDADGDIVHRPNAFDLEDDVNVAYFDNRAHAEMFVRAIDDRQALLAAVRERDNTIARVRALIESAPHLHDPWADDWKGEKFVPVDRLRAALDPQETE